jgi:hypothetical protein
MGSGIHSKTFLYLATVVAAIALSACGEKREVTGPKPPPQTHTTVEETSNPGGGLNVPGQQVPGTLQSPTAPAATPSSLKDPLDDDAGYEPVDPRAVESTDFDKRYTGMTDPDGLFYTGSSTDKLLTYLRLRNEDPNLDMGVKSRNLDAAQSIRSARLSRDKDTGDVVISLKIKEGQNLKNYVLAGGVNEGEGASKVHLAKGRNGLKTTGSQTISGKIKCLDADGGCETIFARLIVENTSSPVPTAIGGSTGSRAVVAILFRESLADIHASLAKSSGNPEYENIRKFWINSDYDSNTDMKLKAAVLKSFEVVNGRSGFDVQIIGENRQLISLGGPLLAPDAGTSVDIPASRMVDPQDSSDIEDLTSYKFDLANFIGSAKITNNNGLGQVRIALKMRKRVGYSQEGFKLTVMRIIKQTVEPNEENLNLK